MGSEVAFVHRDAGNFFRSPLSFIRSASYRAGVRKQIPTCLASCFLFSLCEIFCTLSHGGQKRSHGAGRKLRL